MNWFLYWVPLPVIFLGLIALMLATWAIGRRFGIRARQNVDEDSRTHAGGLHAAILGLLALILGFTFSMSAQRFEVNRDRATEEASAIATAWLRADLADEPSRLEMRDRIRRYVDARVGYYDAKIDFKKRASLEAESRRLQAEVWKLAVASAARAPTAPMAELVNGMNRMFDLYELRQHALMNHVPPTIMWLLVIMSAAATALTGYVAGFGNRRHPTATSVVVLLIALVIVVIVDLDRPTRGFIRGGQEALLDLQRTMRPAVTATR
jgi:hypothetical protein